jgi:ABC-type uncharacterized transport system permease subunit
MTPAATSPVEPLVEPEVVGVRDKADIRRQIKLVVVFAIVAALVLWFLLAIDDPNVTYLNGKRTVDNQPKPFNGMPYVWAALAISVVALVLAAVNRYPRGWLGSIGFLLVGVSFYVAFVIWYFADQTGALEFSITNPLPLTVKYAPPLILGAMAGVLCERAGVINIAIEGQLLMAAFFASVVSALAFSAPVGLLAGAMAGVAMAWLLGIFALRYHVDQVVLGVVLIALAIGLTSFLLGQIPSAKENPDLNTKLTDAQILEPLPIPGLSEIPILGPTFFDQNLLVYIALLSPILVWFLLYQTRWGLRVRSVGEHPKAADTVGIKVDRMRWQAVLLGGVFAGLGGAFFTVGSSGSFDNDASGGQGFMALAAVIMGRWHPIWASMAALFFAFMFTLKDVLGALGKVDSAFIAAAPFLATVIAVAGFVGRVRPPAADGEPYVKA